MALSDERLDAIRQADSGALNFLTLRQFRAIARAIEAEARRDALEEAAKVVQNTDEWKNGKWTSTLCPTTKEAIANAIRAIKDSPPPTA